MALDRLNSPTTFEMPLEVLGHELQFTQERNCRKGRFSPAKLKGKRVIELGTGYGVSGFACRCVLLFVIINTQLNIKALPSCSCHQLVEGLLQ
ncbi:uncharacterized protein [Arachis hypogaea]|uniref:uncharacterized protein isoform X2 n=1 Tax=Arachis hypogaea TaxID=3818 RepID=UPI003B221DFF